MMVVVGLAFEARIAAKSGLPVICAGFGRDLSEVLAGSIDRNCKGLISFGVAGGLGPDLPPGTCVVGSAVVAGDRRFSMHGNWSQQLLQKIPGSISGIIVGSAHPVTTAKGKDALHTSTGALAVDMESHVVADAAVRHGLPMAAVRVICDPAARALPDMAFRSLRPNGSAKVLGLLGSIIREPIHLPAMIRIALDARSARTALMRCGRLIGPSLGFPDPVSTGAN
jgi:adenosylhomocysteine nucleosidase